MALSLSVKSNFKQLTKGLNRLERRIIPAAANSAINKAGTKVKTVIARDLSKEMGVKQSEVKKQIQMKKSNFRTLTAKLIARGRRWNLIRFKAKELKKVLVAKPWNRKRKYKTGFIGNRGRTAFIRLSNNRKDIRPLRGPGMASEFVRLRATKIMKSIAESEVLKQFSRELKRRIAKL